MAQRCRLPCQDECANIAASRLDTLSILGVDPETGAYFARSLENRGFYRLYQIERVGNVWTLTGDTARARGVRGQQLDAEYCMGVEAWRRVAASL
jgi:hypothetical protein